MDGFGVVLWLAIKSFHYLDTSTRPVVLILDGHSSHINLQTAHFACDKGILYCLPPHTTHALQPCDVGVFGPLKKSWNVCVSRYMCDHPGEIVNKNKFASVFKEAWESSIKISTISNSFKASGIYQLKSCHLLFFLETQNQL